MLWRTFASDIPAADSSIVGTCPHTFNFGEHKGPIFPPEISDMFIDALGEDYDHATLAACSLTCHAWVHRSRFHIHSSVRIDSSSNFSRLKELYSPERGLANYVRSLSIDACDMQADGLPAPHPWIAGNIALLKDFTKVKRLALDGLNWNDLTDETKTTILTNYPMVDDLWMSTCDFRHPRHLVTLLQAFPNIKSIRMEALATDTVEWEFMGDNTGSELHLQWLDVGDVCTMPSVVTKWASSYGSLSIENTHISWSHENPTDLSCLLECAGASVKTLSLTLDSRITSHLVGSGEFSNWLRLSARRSSSLYRLRAQPHQPQPKYWNPLTEVASPPRIMRHRKLVLDFGYPQVCYIETSQSHRNLHGGSASRPLDSYRMGQYRHCAL